MSDTGTVEVRIRYESESEARHLTTWHIDRLDVLPRTIDAWGVDAANGDSFAQWVIDPDAAFFELIVPDLE